MVRREIAVAHQRHDDLGVVAIAGHRDVEIADARADVGDDRGDLRAAVGLGAVVDKDAHRPVVFADAVDAAGDLKFGAEGDLEEAVDDFGVGEGLALDRRGAGRSRRLRRLQAPRRAEHAPVPASSAAQESAGRTRPCRLQSAERRAEPAERHDALRSDAAPRGRIMATDARAAQWPIGS